MASARVSRFLLQRKQRLDVQRRSLGGRQRRLRRNRQPLRPLDQAVLLQARQCRDMIVQHSHLERDRARIIRVEHHEIAHRRQQRADQIARAIGDLAVDQRQQHVEVVLAGLVIGELAGEAHGVDGALGAAAHVEETPAGGAVHVFLREAGKARELPQDQFGRGHDAVVVVDLEGEVFRHFGDDLPGIGRQPLAQRGRGALRRAQQRQRRAEFLFALQRFGGDLGGLRSRGLREAPQVTSRRWIRSAACSPEEPLAVSRAWVPSARISRNVASARSR